MNLTRTAGALALALTILPAARAADDDPGAREWSQARGNSARTASCEAAPLAADPTEAWRQPLPGDVLCEPVAWGGTVFVAAGSAKGRELLAFRAANGEPAGRQSLGPGGRVGLAAWQGVVVVVDPTQIRTFQHQATKFSAGWASRGQFAGAPCVHRGFLFQCDGGDLVCYDVLRGGRKAARAPAADASSLQLHEATKGLKEAPVGGPAAVFRSGADGVLYAVNVATVGGVALLSRTRVDDLGGAKTQMRYTQTEVLGTFDSPVGDAERWDLTPCRVDGEVAKDPGAWIVLAPRAFKEGGTGRFVPDANKASGLNLVTAPAVRESVAYAFSTSGDLQAWRATGRQETLVRASEAPPGARAGPATRAQGILYFGNWAVDVAEGRVLWNVQADLATPAVPAGDRRLVFATRTGELVCVTDPPTAAATTPAPVGPASKGNGASAARPAAAAEVPAPRPPREADGVLLDDGRQIEGEFERRGDHVVVRPAKGEPVEVDAGAVVVAESGGTVAVRGDDGPAFRIWRDALRAAYLDSMEAAFQEYLKAWCVDDCRRVLARMRENGASEGRLQRLDGLLSGKASRPAPESRVKKLQAEEAAASKALADGLVSASSWCAKRDFPAAATLLLVEAQRVRGGDEGEVLARAADLVPGGFPWKDAPGGVKLWLRWAEALLPSGARFVAKDDPAWNRLTNAPWTDGATIAFRTRNVLLFCRDDDPVVCGRSLHLAEGSVRALQALLNDGQVERVEDDADRLEVRLHRDRKAYLAEQSASGTKAPEWSGGYFSPRERISRFYVSRGVRRTGGGGGVAEAGPPDMDELLRTLSHELTHHYMNVRWAGGRSGGGPAFWVVEGWAVFVENQAVQIERRGLRFDDATVETLDAMAQVEKAGALFKAERFVDGDHDDFEKLRDDQVLSVKMRNTFEAKHYTERGLWYDQAGALTFFLLHQGGEEGRRAFVEYTRLHYTGSAPRSGWSRLGFESAEDLDRRFAAFLRGLRGG